MVKENLALELLNKHLAVLRLENPLYIESENDLFKVLPSPAKNAVVFLLKSKALIDMTLALVSGMVVEGGTIVLCGGNDAGIRSAKKGYEENIGPVEQKIVGNHSALYVGTNKKLGASKKLESFLSFSLVPYKELAIEVANMPGVFSAGELDEGTRLLLDHIPYDKKKVLDIGCGAGVIGAIYKKMNPESDVTMSDSSKLAVFAARKTLEKNNLKAKVVESDVFDSIQGGPASTRGDASSMRGGFDLIVCNPPFHKGIETDYSFIEKLARGARRHLAPGGQIYIVANSFLPYKVTLERHLRSTVTLADTKKFSVYMSKP